MSDNETILECVVCGTEIRPEEGEEFKHVVDSKTGRNLVFCGEDGTLFAQLISMDLDEDSEVLEEIRGLVAEEYAEKLGQ